MEHQLFKFLNTTNPFQRFKIQLRSVFKVLILIILLVLKDEKLKFLVNHKETQFIEWKNRLNWAPGPMIKAIIQNGRFTYISRF